MAPQREILQQGLNPNAKKFVPRSVLSTFQERKEQTVAEVLASITEEKCTHTVIKTPAQNDISIPKTNPWNNAFPPTRTEAKSPVPRVLQNKSPVPGVLHNKSPVLLPASSPRLSSPLRNVSLPKRKCVILRGLPHTGKQAYANNLCFTVKSRGVDKNIPPHILHENFVDKPTEFSRALANREMLIVVVGVHEKVSDYDWMIKRASQHGYDTKLIEFRPNYEQIDLIFKNEISLAQRQKFLLDCQKWEPDSRAELKAPYRTWDNVDTVRSQQRVPLEEEHKQSYPPSTPSFVGEQSPSPPSFVGEQYLLRDDASVCSIDSGSSENSFMYDSCAEFNFRGMSHGFPQMNMVPHRVAFAPVRERSYLKPL